MILKETFKILLASVTYFLTFAINFAENVNEIIKTTSQPSWNVSFFYWWWGKRDFYSSGSVERGSLLLFNHTCIENKLKMVWIRREIKKWSIKYFFTRGRWRNTRDGNDRLLTFHVFTDWRIFSYLRICANINSPGKQIIGDVCTPHVLHTWQASANFCSFPPPPQRKQRIVQLTRPQKVNLLHFVSHNEAL